MNKLSSLVLNIAAGVFFFFFFLFLFFPFETIIENLLSEVEGRTAGAFRITVKEIDPGVVFKTKFREFAVHSTEKGLEDTLLSFPEVRIGVRYFSLIKGNLEASFIAKGTKGKLDGWLSFSKTENRISINLDRIVFDDFPYISKKLAVPLKGSLEGSLKLTLLPNQWTRNEGQVDLKILNLMIPEGRISPYPGFDIELPDTELVGKEGGRLKLKLERGRLEVQEINFPGADLSLNLDGRIQLNRQMPLSRLALNGTFKVSERLSQAFPLMVVIEKQKNEEGIYPVTLSGRFNKPRIKVGTFDVL